MINKTFGGAGADFTDPHAAWVWLAGLGGLADDYTFTQTGSCTLTGNMGWSGTWIVAHNGFTVTFINTNPSYTIEIPSGSTYLGTSYRFEFLIYDATQPGGYLAEGLNFYVTGTSSGVRVLGGHLWNLTASPLASCIFDKCKLIGNNTYMEMGMFSYNAAGAICIYKSCNVYNCMIGIGISGGASGIGSQTKVWENVSVYGGVYGAQMQTDDAIFGGCHFRNVVCCDQAFAHGVSPVAFSVPATGTYNTIENCADDDGTLPAWATSSQENITPENEFISLDSSSSDFLKPKSTGIIGSAGTTPTYVTEDIAGLPIPNGAGQIPIGCHALEYIGFPDMIIDSGSLYKNYGEAGELLLGATRGGNTFKVEADYIDMRYDGAAGSVAGGKVLRRVTPRIIANIIEISPDVMQLALPASAQSGNETIDTLTRALEIALSDYCDNITLVGEVSGKTQPVICKVLNALADGNFEIKKTDKDEAVLQIQFTGHYDPDDLNTDPWELYFPTL